MHDHKDGFELHPVRHLHVRLSGGAIYTDYTPREVARRALEGDPTLLEDDNVWFCFYCYTCQSRCPRKNSVAVINQVVRSMQVESGYGVKHVEMFAAWGSTSTTRAWAARRTLFFRAIGRGLGRRSGPTTWTTC